MSCPSIIAVELPQNYLQPGELLAVPHFVDQENHYFGNDYDDFEDFMEDYLENYSIEYNGKRYIKIYCHNSQDVKDSLLKTYNSFTKAMYLVMHGDCSDIYYRKITSYCFSYGESWKQNAPQLSNNLDDDFPIYLFKNGKWYLNKVGDSFEPINENKKLYNKKIHYLNERIMTIDLPYTFVKGFDEFLLANDVDVNNMSPKSWEKLSRLREKTIDAFDHITDYFKK